MSELADDRRTALVIGAIMVRPGSEFEEHQFWLTRKDHGRDTTYPTRFTFEQYPSLSRDELAAKMDEMKKVALELFDQLDGFRPEIGTKVSITGEKHEVTTR